MKKYAIIVAGGTGTRMKANQPKQFLEVAGKPILWHTIKRFDDADHSTMIIIVLPKAYIKKWQALTKKHDLDTMHLIIPGGETRFQSVKNGLQLVHENGVVAVHDAVRPLASIDLIRKCFADAEKYGSAVPVVPVNESLRKINGKQSEVADRSSYVSVQTPQCFQSKILLKAYQQSYRKSFTDDASVVESIGKKIHLVEGERENIKITYPADLKIAELFLKR